MQNTIQQKDFIEKVTAAQGIVHKVCTMYCDHEEDRRDLFQEIMIQLWKSFPSFRGEAKFSTWMYKVSFNVAVQFLRKQQKKPQEIPLKNFDQAEGEATVSSDQHFLLKKAIQQLNEMERNIILLYLEDVGNEEIAEIMGISQNYVRVKMTRIRRTLKELVGT